MKQKRVHIGHTLSLGNNLLSERMRDSSPLHSLCPCPAAIPLCSLPRFGPSSPCCPCSLALATFQAGHGTFNRAKLLNVGVREALRDEEWDCLFLHDVDLLPENDHNLYVCDPRGPRHVAVAMNKFGYR